MFAASLEKGICNAMPDVCKTPAPPAPAPVPMPYPNIAQLPMATGASTKVLINMMGAVTAQSKINISSGDEAGVAGGVTSGKNVGEATFKQPSQKVFAEGQGMVPLGSMTGQNGTSANVPGLVAVPSQDKVLLLG